MKKLNDKGQIIFFLTAAFVVLGLFVGLAVDGGRAYLLKAQLGRMVDPAALAAASKLPEGVPAAQEAACNSAKMNGFEDCTGLTVTQKNGVPTPGGGTANGVEVIATATMPTSFIMLAGLIGCTTCDSVTVAASATATVSAYDLVMNMDDTNSMQGTKLTGAKNGANALTDAIVPAGAGSVAKVSMVPFRGCYNSTGGSSCKDRDDWSAGSVVSLPVGTANNNATLHSAINALNGAGGSGTNICEGLTEARIKLFQSPGTRSRANAAKFIIILTDADNNYTSTASYTQCRPTGSGAAQDKNLGLRTYNLATDIKSGTNPLTSGQPAGKEVTIYVILYGSGTGTAPNCNASFITSASNPENATYWKNLGSCIATSPAHVYLAPTGADIQAAFEDIISRLPVRLLS
jgi:hypothetical protein